MRLLDGNVRVTPRPSISFPRRVRSARTGRGHGKSVFIESAKRKSGATHTRGALARGRRRACFPPLKPTAGGCLVRKIRRGETRLEVTLLARHHDQSDEKNCRDQRYQLPEVVCPEGDAQLEPIEGQVDRIAAEPIRPTTHDRRRRLISGDGRSGGPEAAHSGDEKSAMEASTRTTPTGVAKEIGANLRCITNRKLTPNRIEQRWIKGGRNGPRLAALLLGVSADIARNESTLQPTDSTSSRERLLSPS